MTGERDGAIPLADLAAIAGSVQEAIHQIARALNDRSGSGRSPQSLKALSNLEAVGIEAGSAVLAIEAPHDMEELDLDLGDGDAGVQAISLFVESLGALAEGEEPPGHIGSPAMKSIRRFTKAVGSHDHVAVEATARGDIWEAAFVPRLIADPGGQPPETTDRSAQVEVIGRLYEVNLNQNSYRIEDEFGRKRHLTLAEDLDASGLARTLLGKPVHVTGIADQDTPGDAERLVATSIRAAAPVDTSEYFDWDLARALKGVAPLRSMDDLVIADLDEQAFAEFWGAIAE